MSESISYRHEKDGTLVVTVPKGTNVGRVLVQEEGTCIGRLFYPDHFADVSKMYVHLPPDLQPTCNELAIEELQLPWDKAQLSTEKTQLSEKDKTFGHISRQEAIDALAEYIHNVDKAIGTGHLSANECAEAAHSVLAELPSAQPEIIRCNSCKYWTQSTGKIKGYGLGRCDFHEADLVVCNGFCYWAERRNNG